MHSCVTSKNAKWCHLIWPTLYTVSSTQHGITIRQLDTYAYIHCIIFIYLLFIYYYEQTKHDKRVIEQLKK